MRESVERSRSTTMLRTKVVRGVTLRADPARETCFTVVDTSAEMADYADMSSVARPPRLHKPMHNAKTKQNENPRKGVEIIDGFPRCTVGVAHEYCPPMLG